MKLVFFWCSLMGLHFIARGQILTVKDFETRKPVEMATIMSAQTIQVVSTNAAGQADVSGFAQSDQLEIRRVGYKTAFVRFADLSEKNFELFLTASSIQLDEVVVSATRWSQASRNIPSKITVITAREAALFNPQTAADMLSTSGEVFIQKSQQGGGSPMIRGFATNRLLYSVDGVRMNTAIFRAGNIQNVISLDPFAIERTEIFFGPGSIIYGSDAIGGVMSFQTLMPQLSFVDKPLISGKVISRFASANQELTHHMDVNAGGKKWSAVTSFTYSKYGDLRMGSIGPNDYLRPDWVKRIAGVDSVVKNNDPLVQTPSGYSQTNLMQKLRFMPSQRWDIQYGFHYSETSAYARYDRLLEKQPNGLPASAVWNYGPQIWMMNNLTLTHIGQNRWYDNMTVRLAQQYFEESRIDRGFRQFRLRTNLEKVQAWSADISFEKQVEKNRFVYGAEYVINKVESTGSAVHIMNGSNIPVPDRYPASRWRSLGFYLNHQLKFSDRWLLQTGIRFSAFRINSDFTRHLNFYPFPFAVADIKKSATTASAGLVYSPAPSWKVTANISTGFRAPNVDDIGKIFDFVQGEVMVPNPALQAEYAYNSELSISKIFGDWVKLDLSGYYTYLDNAMVRRPYQLNGEDSILYGGKMSKVHAIQNAAFGTVFGCNAGIEIMLPKGFRITSRYNYQLGREEMNNGGVNPSRHAAPAFGFVRLSYKKRQWNMELNTTWQAEVGFQRLNPEEQVKRFIYAKDANGNPYAPGWKTLNVHGRYEFRSNWSVSAGVENITNIRYRPFSSGLAAPGRNVIISLRAQF